MLVYQGRHVDLEAPVCMTEDQLQKLVRFFERVYGKTNVRRKEARDKERSGMHAEMGLKKWSIKELAELLGPKTNAQLAREFRRTEMAIQLKRGDFAPDFIAWARRKRLTSVRTEDAIRRYLDREED